MVWVILGKKKKKLEIRKKYFKSTDLFVRQ